MTKNEVIELVNNTIESLTWNRLAMVVTVCAFGVLMAFAFDNRVRIVDRLLTPTVTPPLEPWLLSTPSKKEVQTLVNSQALIGAAVVWDVDLKKNRANTIFIHPEDLTVGVVTELTLPQAFFDSEPRSRAQVISVINNSFTCGPTENVTFVKPLANKFPVTCLLAIPPYVGGFAGFIGLELLRTPTATEKDALRIELTRISINIYLRDAENRIRKQD